jgi:hypothetical protein
MNNIPGYELNQSFNSITRFLHGRRTSILLQHIREYYDTGSSFKILDIGAGPCKLYKLLRDNNFDFSYTAIEFDPNFVAIASDRYSSHANFNILCGSIEDYLHSFNEYDIIVALDSLEHIDENLVCKLVFEISKSNINFFYASVPNELGPSILIKNLGSFLMGYSRHSEYSLKDTFYSFTCHLDKLPRHNLRHRGFDWRWLAQLLRYNFKISKIHRSPFDFIPLSFSPSLIFFCLPDSLHTLKE